jgi:putative FmdB family regulatory protein
MPIYQYKCESCGEQFDVIQKFADVPVAVHEKCGGPVHRMMTTPSFQFKGSGFYVTDYAKAGAPPGKDGNGSSDSKSDSKSEGKSDSKSDAKSDSKPDTKATESKTETKTESKSGASSSPSAAPSPTTPTKT